MTDLVKILSDYDLSLLTQRQNCLTEIIRKTKTPPIITPFKNVWDAYQLIALIDVNAILEAIRDMNTHNYIIGKTSGQNTLFWAFLIERFITSKNIKINPHPFDSPAAKIHAAFRKFALLTNTSSASKTNLLSYDLTNALKATIQDEASKLANYQPETPKKEFWNSAFGIFLSCLPLFIPAIIRGYRCNKKHGDWKFWHSDKERELQTIKDIVSSVKSEVETVLNSNINITDKLSGNTHPRNLSINVDPSHTSTESKNNINAPPLLGLQPTDAPQDNPYDMIYHSPDKSPLLKVKAHTPPNTNPAEPAGNLAATAKDGSKESSSEFEKVGDGSDEDIQTSLNDDSPPQRTTPTPN